MVAKVEPQQAEVEEVKARQKHSGVGEEVEAAAEVALYGLFVRERIESALEVAKEFFQRSPFARKLVGFS